MALVDDALAHLVEEHTAIPRDREGFEYVEECFGSVLHAQIPYDKVLDPIPQGRILSVGLYQTVAYPLIVGHVDIIEGDTQIPLYFLHHRHL